MKRSILTAAALTFACLGLAGCSGGSETFTILGPSEELDQDITPAGAVDECAISDETVSDIIGADMGTWYHTPFNINQSQFDTDSCTWSNESHLVVVAAMQRPIFPEQTLACNMPPLRGEESLDGFGDTAWWTWSSGDEYEKGTINACDGEIRVHVEVRTQSGDRAEIKQQAEELARLAVETMREE